jgi:hypothetical protein
MDAVTAEVSQNIEAEKDKPKNDKEKEAVRGDAISQTENDIVSSLEAPVDLPRSQCSPHPIDQTIQKQGRDFHELLQLFKQTNTEPLSSFIMQTPTHKSITTIEPSQKEATKQGNQRESPRLKEKGTKGKPVLKLAQDLVAKRRGVLQDNQNLEGMTLQKYLDMYKKPLSDDSMEAIKKLAEIAEEDKKKKKKAKKDKLKEVKKSKKASPDGGVEEA